MDANKVLFIEPFSGISGNMFLGAMLGLGVPQDHLKSELAKLGLDDFRLDISRKGQKGIFGIYVDVVLTREQHHHRHLSHIREIIGKSSLGQRVKDRALGIFTLIAEAEAKIHDKTVDSIHFHEVGAVDAIVDICGAAICLDYLSPARVLSAPPELGSGMVECAHGCMPVPAPATEEILSGITTRRGGVDFEATTPTGAAILKCITDEYVQSPMLQCIKTAYGAGSYEHAKVPNLLRASICQSTVKHRGHLMVECNIDDMNPEWYSHILDELLALGADEAFVSPVLMKKSRPGNLLSVLCRAEIADTIKQYLFRHTTTAGLRSYSVDKMELERKSNEKETPWGKVRIKEFYIEGRHLRSKAEYEDCRRLAKENNITLAQVYRALGLRP